MSPPTECPAGTDSPLQYLSQEDGRPLSTCRGEESPGSTGARVLGNAQAWRHDGQCHRDRPPVLQDAVRVKRCGKSAPARRVTGRLGKPHSEQVLIGGLWAPGPSPGRTLQASSNRRRRWMAAILLRRDTEPGLCFSWLKSPHRLMRALNIGAMATCARCNCAPPTGTQASSWQANGAVCAAP